VAPTLKPVRPAQQGPLPIVTTTFTGPRKASGSLESAFELKASAALARFLNSETGVESLKALQSPNFGVPVRRVVVNYSWDPNHTGPANGAVNLRFAQGGDAYVEIKVSLANLFGTQGLFVTAPPTGMKQLRMPGRFVWDSVGLGAVPTVDWGASYLSRIEQVNPGLRALIDPSSPKYDRNVLVWIDERGVPQGSYLYRPITLEEYFADEFGDQALLSLLGKSRSMVGSYGTSFIDAGNWATRDVFGKSFASEFGLLPPAGLETGTHTIIWDR
jgi:hypothetical protein